MKHARSRISVELRGQEIDVDLVINGPDREVGLLGPWWEDEILYDQDGKQLRWELTDLEMEKISEAVCDLFYAPMGDEDA